MDLLTIGTNGKMPLVPIVNLNFKTSELSTHQSIDYN